MVNLYFSPDDQLTLADRLTLDVLEKDYEHFKGKNTASQSDVATCETDSTGSLERSEKQSRYDSGYESVTPEGQSRVQCPKRPAHKASR